MKLYRSGAVRAASTLALLSTSVITTPVFAQSPPGTTAPQVEEVVVTGSLIRGATEDGPVSVEVFSAADLEAQGAPNIVEFTRSLTIVWAS